MRFTFVTTRQFHTISRLWFGFAASPRIPRFDREPFNSTGGTFTHEVTNFTSARIPMLLEKVADAALRCPRAVQARPGDWTYFRVAEELCRHVSGCESQRDSVPKPMGCERRATPALAPQEKAGQTPGDPVIQADAICRID